MKKRVLLGMSGGIDSSVAAMLLQEEGYEVVGITFLFGGSNEKNKIMADDAKQLADNLGIKHLTVDLRTKFRATIIKYFITEYCEGRTPFPCAYCNPKLKFFYLEKYAKTEQCEFIATGHYVITDFYMDKKFIYKGVDPEKDQSFFLWGLSSEIIQKLIFPLGKFKKTEIRKFAEQRGFKKLSKKKDSLGICFIDGKDYRIFLEQEGIKSPPGNFVDKNGLILGQHSGIINYTIGQRRGLGLNLNFPVFIAEIRLDDNEIVLGKYDDLYKQKIIINNYYISEKQKDSMFKDCIVRVRYRLQETPCELHILDGSRAEVRLLQPEAMISPGQTAVFYKNDRLIGGGFIESAE